MKMKIQISIIILGVGALIYGILKMSETKTMILPSWVIAIPITVIVCAVSYGLGAVAKNLLHSDFHQMTFASIVMIIFVSVYAAVEYKPTLRIVIAENYTGEVKLFLSNNTVEDSKILVNNFGVGYITKKDFDNGFSPKILRGTIEITKDVKEYSKGIFANTPAENYSFQYFSFVIPGSSKDVANNIEYLVKIGAVDTLRLPRK